MLITLAGLALLALRSCSCRAWVRKNGDLTFRSITLSQPFSGKVSKDSPQAAPALFTRMSSEPSLAAYAAARPLAPSTVETSAGSAKQGPSADSSRTVSSQAAALREEM